VLEGRVGSHVPASGLGWLQEALHLLEEFFEPAFDIFEAIAKSHILLLKIRWGTCAPASIRSSDRLLLLSNLQLEQFVPDFISF